MANVVKIRKGLDINLKGKATRTLIDVGKSESYAVVPDHYDGIVPKVTVRAGDKVKAGSVVMTDKNFPEIRFVAPVSGEVTAVNRGEKRKLLSIVIRPDDRQEYESAGVKALSAYSGEEIKAVLLQSGLWPYIKQRPYDCVARPDATPRDIFVTACNSAPLAPDFDFIAAEEADTFQVGLDALAKLTPGKVYVGVKKGAVIRPQDVELIELEGPHPVGNAGVMINHVKPVNKGEVVWTLNAADVLFIGRLFLKGAVDFTRLVALTGSEMTERGYAKVIAGCTVDSLAGRKVLDSAQTHVRLISGNVLTGTKVSRSDYLGAYDNQLTAIPEGDDVNEFFGWATPGFDKYSVSRSYLGWLAGRAKEYVLDARIRGGKRAMIMSNEYDKVFPMDIYPEYLLKAIIAFDIDKMENLGIYEVAPEDFALCEFVDTSKIELQHIVRRGLDLLYREMN
ncbi:MAG: Na(+)-translocating NADH-quinone reductase subunit A [Tannerella sp.]|jgi:Na+-transporting NADH:ubiquinone oxidoreductase subunit A|nr:Na(+)-translocating NADH-quinone reductase subunit A [Tannerella sp.]